MITDKIKIRLENFSSYGLNKYRNFLHSPKCENGKDIMLLLSNKEQLFKYMTNILIMQECFNAGIFAISYDNRMYVAIADFPINTSLFDEYEYEDELSDEDLIDNDEDLENYVSLYCINEINYDFFAEMDAEFQLCHYGLLIEIAPGEWKIIEN